MEGIYTAEGLEDRTALWAKYHYLVRQEALRIHKRLPASVELDDLIQAGAIGFLGAVETFDPRKGVTLSAWITQRVRWSLIDELRERDWVPRRVRTQAREIVAVIREIEQKQGREATEMDISRHMGISIDELNQILADTNTSQMYSIEELQEMTSGAWETAGDEHESLNPIYETMRLKLVDSIAQHIRYFPEREQRILQFYYQQDLNMKEIALILGVTETRVSQLHSLAIKRLRSRVGDVTLDC